MDQRRSGHYHCLLARCGMKHDLTVVMSPPITTLIYISINRIEYSLINLDVLDKNFIFNRISRLMEPHTNFLAEDLETQLYSNI